MWTCILRWVCWGGACARIRLTHGARLDNLQQRSSDDVASFVGSSWSSSSSTVNTQTDIQRHTYIHTYIHTHAHRHTQTQTQCRELDSYQSTESENLVLSLTDTNVSPFQRQLHIYCTSTDISWWINVTYNPADTITVRKLTMWLIRSRRLWSECQISVWKYHHHQSAQFDHVLKRDRHWVIPTDRPTDRQRDIIWRINATYNHADTITV